MRYWKRTKPDGTIRTVESYSHDDDVEGAIEITEIEFQAYLAALPPAPIDPIEERRQEARYKAVAAIKANKTGASWGVILYDQAVALGLIEPE